MSREEYLQRRDQLLMQDEEIAELKAENAKLREAASSWLRWPTEGHKKQLESALITPVDTAPGPAPESSQEAPEKT